MAIAEALRRRWPDVRLVFAGIRGRAEEKIVPALGYELRFVPASGMPPLHDVPGMARFALTLRAGVREARRILDEIVPDAVIGTGGYASAPVLLAAVGAILPRSRERRPATLVHEQNAVPGKLNRLVGRRVDRVAVTFPESAGFFPRSRVFHSGYPLRTQIGGIDRAEARRRLDLPADAFVLLAFGGSLGARTINRGVAAALPTLLADPAVFVLHGTGRYSGADYDPQGDTARVVDALGLPSDRLSRYRPADFLDPIGAAYAAADVVVCRAGAGTLSEVQACGLPAIIVPKKDCRETTRPPTHARSRPAARPDRPGTRRRRSPRSNRRHRRARACPNRPRPVPRSGRPSGHDREDSGAPRAGGGGEDRGRGRGPAGGYTPRSRSGQMTR